MWWNVVFKGITIQEALSKMDGIEVKNISVEHNSCDVALSKYDFTENCWSWFQGVLDIKVYHDGVLVMDHSPCMYCEMEWGIAHEPWCRTRWDD